MQVAREQLAADGLDRASYNQIIVDAGISKASAYQYFDGRDDLVGAVLADVIARAEVALGRWASPPDAASFWTGLDRGAKRLIAHLAQHSDDRAILSQRLPEASPGQAWLADLIADGLQLGIIDPTIDGDLLRAATARVFQAIDAWVLGRLTADRLPRADADLDGAWRLLAGLWHTPADLRPEAAHDRKG